jgi:hypothetical protein
MYFILLENNSFSEKKNPKKISDFRVPHHAFSRFGRGNRCCIFLKIRNIFGTLTPPATALQEWNHFEVLAGTPDVRVDCTQLRLTYPPRWRGY